MNPVIEDLAGKMEQGKTILDQSKKDERVEHVSNEGEDLESSKGKQEGIDKNKETRSENESDLRGLEYHLPFDESVCKWLILDCNGSLLAYAYVSCRNSICPSDSMLKMLLMAWIQRKS
ncbi:hypothetical protein M9H77_07804 [Catharanthus roseus]|uniref:Uncharacterized protein n=1 Tax=Catharanthus roseus TaxID=4058 RepID=A0ACC0BW65_CATRO|nr:hypothetical protein M9H77_07804 [Catharanthus roseus]